MRSALIKLLAGKSQQERLSACSRSLWSGQAVVECAVILPVVVALILIVGNLTSYLAVCASFDRASSRAVLVYGVSPRAAGVADASAEVTKSLRSAIESSVPSVIADRIAIEVSADPVSFGSGDESHEESAAFSLVSGLQTYECTLTYEPWPRFASFAGVPINTPVHLTHKTKLTIDPYRNGVVW